ncbi:24-hydroxycholesterol 7-alpha-hydroxylase isoform X4 [Carcharodon carcharias]|uniref:24-hydroxycholesterol 7-alpha-hydroxylase isoform X4 n=1 Tax=Carcharodon carcharias TaxID=13397 RepID=UPI001B7E014F|nr:24-hydroxycholesterol 7-alpha-hydroxylase isoform X4 [Carcharodon carcharias]
MGAEGCVLLLVPMLLALAAAALLCWVFKQKEPRQTAAPPCIGGWIPWIRASIRFGKAPLEFIEQARAEYGAVFTVVAAGKRLTFITEEEDFEIFFRSKNVDFQEAVQEPVWHTASISRKSFYKSHTAVHDMLKGRLAPSRLHLFSANLSKEFCEHLMYLGTRGTDNLYDLIWHSMYPAVVNNLFGRGICPTDRNTVREFEDHFQKFDRDFEFGSQLPEFLLRDWAKSKHWLLSLFERIVAKVEKMKPVDDSSKTLLQHLLDTLNGNSTANYSLLMLWASQANALPITFWTLAFIISNPIVYQTVMKELCSVFGDQGNKKIQPEESDLQKLSYLKCCILEAIRLRAPGVITRKVVQPLKIKNYIVPSGDMLMLSIYWAHRNPKHFPEPEKFLPDRWKKADIEKQVFLDGFMAFGGGRYQCPGRWFALLEIQMFAALIFHKYEFTLLDPLPKESPLHLVGTQQPLGPCRVEYKCR